MVDSNRNQVFLEFRDGLLKSPVEVVLVARQLGESWYKEAWVVGVLMK